MEGRRKKKGKGIDSILFWKPFPVANYDRFRHWKQNHGGGLAPRGPEKHFHHDIIPNSGSDLFFALYFSSVRGADIPSCHHISSDQNLSKSSCVATFLHPLYSSFLLSTNISFTIPIVSRSRSRMEIPSCTHRRRNRGVVISRSVA